MATKKSPTMLFFVAIFFGPVRLPLASAICPWVSEDDTCPKLSVRESQQKYNAPINVSPRGGGGGVGHGVGILQTIFFMKGPAEQSGSAGSWEIWERYCKAGCAAVRIYTFFE